MQTEKPQEARYDGLHCNMTIQPLSRRVLVVRISGTDIGESGEALCWS